MVKSSWNDIDAQGRKMAKIVRLCESFVDRELKKSESERNHDLILAYMDRLIKSSAHQAQLTNINLKLNMLFKLAEKKYADEITEQGLRELASK
jgi:hypothetical protein